MFLKHIDLSEPLQMAFGFGAFPALQRVNMETTRSLLKQTMRGEVGSKLQKRAGWINTLLMGNKQK